MKTFYMILLITISMPLLSFGQNIVIIETNNIPKKKEITSTYEYVISSLESGSPSNYLFGDYNNSWKLENFWFQVELLKFANYFPDKFYSGNMIPTFISEYQGIDSGMWLVQTFAKIEEEKVY
ncbi:MAG: hypothetical protein SFU99_17750, partial [Saprospiraceae bacterium]|nr:hypothetical protein [Saprospiraceae bacterium]